MDRYKIDRAAFDKLVIRLETMSHSDPLNLVDLGNVFGHHFWTLFALCVTGNEIKTEGKVDIIVKDKSIK